MSERAFFSVVSVWFDSPASFVEQVICKERSGAGFVSVALFVVTSELVHGPSPLLRSISTLRALDGLFLVRTICWHVLFLWLFSTAVHRRHSRNPPRARAKNLNRRMVGP